MEDRAKLVYFLNTVKEELAFENPIDFKNKIENDFHFRFKVQKFVFLAKYFGWENNYKFALYPRGHYSGALAKDYYSNVFNNCSLNEDKFKKDSFKRFIEDKSEYDLEAASTILYYKNFYKNFSLNDAINTLNDIKPHINASIVEKSYFEVNDFPIIENSMQYSLSNYSLENTKRELSGKIIGLEQSFGSFKESSNLDFIINSLNYLQFVLYNESFDIAIEHDLLEFISKYVADIEKLYSFSLNAENLFYRMNIDFLKGSFRQLQNYFNQELVMDSCLNFEKFDNSSYENKYESSELIYAFEPVYPFKSDKITFDDMFGFHIVLDDFSNIISQESLNAMKNDLSDKLGHLIQLSYKSEPSYNSYLIAGFLDYLRSILGEDLSLEKKGILFNLIHSYVFEIEKIFSIADTDCELFENMNLYVFEVFFYRFQNYICQLLETDACGKDEYFDFSSCYCSVYKKIHEFLLNEIIPRYSLLVSCARKDEDEDGNPAIEFYIQYDGYLTFFQRNDLTRKVLNDLYEFCIASRFPNAFHDVSIFLIQR